RFAALSGTRHAVAVNNGTTALVASLQALDLQSGDEVITSPFTFAATLNAILEAGATVRFADIRVEDFNVDPASIAERVGERTKV
ncbi:DegT/DnrJ/EryC1/StrS family aminotransferase, partial [Escherichia coli]|uniref:DegT/DnrJ/EryC1/StrS family aminotransferase n=1 Tax=Escherichia coli TaxID=562 RepID=UPI0039E1F8C9